MTDKELIFYAKKIVELKEWGKEYSIELLSSIFHTDFQDTEQIMEELKKKGIVFDWEQAKKDMRFNLEETKKAFFLAKDSVKILADMKKEVSKKSIVCYCDEKKHLVSLLLQSLSYETLEVYTIYISKLGEITFSPNSPLERVGVFSYPKRGYMEISISNRGNRAYTFAEAEWYYNLFKGCAEINEFFKKNAFLLENTMSQKNPLIAGV